MQSGRKISTSAVTRRGFLKRVGAAAGAAGLAPALSSPFVSTRSCPGQDAKDPAVEPFRAAVR